MTRYTKNESKCINVFNAFINSVEAHIKDKTDITDSTNLKHVLIDYLFVDKKLATTDSVTFKLGEINNEDLTTLKSELKVFYRFLQERGAKTLAKNLGAMPLRLSNDKFIYNRLTPFQKENTLIFFDKRNPHKTLGYILFIPDNLSSAGKPKIWSWTLMFKFGKYIFKSVTGQEGAEYIF
jgi:hypothetical protein